MDTLFALGQAQVGYLPFYHKDDKGLVPVGLECRCGIPLTVLAELSEKIAPANKEDLACAEHLRWRKP